MVGRKGSYVTRRKGKLNWYVFLRSPGEKARWVNLETTDKVLAELRAAPLIHEHRVKLLARKARTAPAYVATEHHGYVWALGEHPGAAVGGKVIATPDKVYVIDANGSITDTFSNRHRSLADLEPVADTTGLPAIDLTGIHHATLPHAVAARGAKVFHRPATAKKAAKPGIDTDSEIIATWVADRRIAPRDEAKCRATLKLLQSVNGGKTLAQTTRDDVRRLVGALRAQGLKSGTVQRKITLLRAAVNGAIKDEKLEKNPFAGLGHSDGSDAIRRLPLSGADMAACRARLDTLSPADRALFVLLSTSGMRFSEAYNIQGEYEENGVPFFLLLHGVKTAQSQRRVPVPEDFLPFQKERTVLRLGARLFSDEAGGPATNKRLARFLDACGIEDPRKTLHSLRHRAKDRLRAAGCPLDVQYELLGHEQTTVASSYGHGYPVAVLKQWLDKVGY